VEVSFDVYCRFDIAEGSIGKMPAPRYLSYCMIFPNEAEDHNILPEEFLCLLLPLSKDDVLV